MAKRVLIVEDERDVARLVADVLTLEGFQTREVAGDEVLRVALAFGPDAILLDLMMPGLDGFAVAALLQAEAATRAIPIIVMTAMPDAATRAAEIGAVSLLVKPFDIDDLVATMRQVTAEHG